MGARGPKPGTGGRPRKSLSEKILDGNPGKRNIRVLKNYTDLEGADMPNPKDYLLDAQKDGKAFQAEEIYQSVWKWLNDRHSRRTFIIMGANIIWGCTRTRCWRHGRGTAWPGCCSASMHG